MIFTVPDIPSRLFSPLSKLKELILEPCFDTTIDAKLVMKFLFNFYLRYQLMQYTQIERKLIHVPMPPIPNTINGPMGTQEDINFPYIGFPLSRKSLIWIIIVNMVVSNEEIKLLLRSSPCMKALYG
jgi:hypothetical protein